jgi:hypothetical protein
MIYPTVLPQRIPDGQQDLQALRPHEEVAHTQGEKRYTTPRIPNLATTEDIRRTVPILNPVAFGNRTQGREKREAARRPTDQTKDERKELARKSAVASKLLEYLRASFHIEPTSTWTRLAKGSSALEQARQFEQYAFKHWEEKLCRFDNLERCYGALLLPSTAPTRTIQQGDRHERRHRTPMRPTAHPQCAKYYPPHDRCRVRSIHTLQNPGRGQGA